MENTRARFWRGEQSEKGYSDAEADNTEIARNP